MKNGIYLLLLLTLAGCSHEFQALYATETQVISKREYDQGMKHHVQGLRKGPVVDGSDCLVHYPFMGARALDKSQRLAIREALGKAGQPYNGLAYVDVTWRVYGLWSCFDMRGTATVDEPHMASR